jgi:hypothetical protein
MDRLKEAGLWDDSLVVVTADHGLTFQPGIHRRGIPLSPENRDDVMAVPLFVKYPRQRHGKIDDRMASTTDIVPTIADVLGIELQRGWAPDGFSLVGAQQRRSYEHTYGGNRVVVRSRLRPETTAERFSEVLGPPGQSRDLYRVGPHGDLVGRAVDDVPSGPADATVAIEVVAPDRYLHPNDEARVPARLVATVSGAGPGRWVAIALNGVIAGVGRTHERDGQTGLQVMLDPSLFADDTSMAAFIVDGGVLRRTR